MCPPGIYVPRSLHQKDSERSSARAHAGKTDFKGTEGVAFDWLVLPQIHPFQAVTALSVRLGKHQGNL